MGNYYLYQIGYFIIRALPLRAAYALATIVADCHYLLAKNDRNAVEANLKAILGKNDIPSSMVREVFHNFGKYLVDFFTQTKFVTDDFLKAHVHIEHSEYMNEVLNNGKGGILVGAHLGNWELAGAVLSKLGYPISIVALPHKDARVNKFFNDQREFFGITVIPSTTAIRRCLEHARSNRIIAILGDRDFSRNGMMMDFLGRKTSIPKGAALFSLKTGAPILICFFMRVGENNLRVTFAPPIYPPQASNGKINDEDVKCLIQKYLGPIEDEIRQRPTQWLLFREFWNV